MMVGGLSDSLSPNDIVRQLCLEMKEKVESEVNKKYNMFEPVKYKHQLVNGTNYFIKIKVGESEYIHIRVHRSFDGQSTYHSHKTGKSEMDLIEYF